MRIENDVAPIWWLKVAGLLLALCFAVYGFPAVSMYWWVDDPYFFPFVNDELIASLRQWIQTWGVERLLCPLSARYLFPLGPGLAHVARLFLHAGAGLSLTIVMGYLGWPRPVSALAGALFVVLPFHVESTLWACFCVHAGHFAAMGMVACFVASFSAGGRKAWAWRLATVGLGLLACLGYGSYTFAPMLIVAVVLAPAVQSQTWGWRDVIVATLVCSLAPIAAIAGMMLAKRYEGNGPLQFSRAPRVALSTQYHAVRQLVNDVRRIQVWDQRDPYNNRRFASLVAIAGLTAAIVYRQAMGRQLSKDDLPGPTFYVWAYGWMLVGYAPYWFRGASPGTPRMHYFAGLGIAALFSGLLVSVCVPWRRLGAGLVGALLLVFATAAHTQAWKFASESWIVREYVQTSYQPTLTGVFADVYATLGKWSWEKGQTQLRIYDRENIHQWVVTGWFEFWSVFDKRPHIDRMIEKTRVLASEQWALLTPGEQERWLSDVEKSIAKTRQDHHLTASDVPLRSLNDALLQLTQVLNEAASAPQVESPLRRFPQAAF